MILVHCRRVNKRCAMIAARIRRCICNYISRDIVFRKYFPNFIAFTQVASNSYFPIEKHLNPFLPHEQDFISCYFRALRGPSRRIKSKLFQVNYSNWQLKIIQIIVATSIRIYRRNVKLYFIFYIFIHHFI